jgi:hypothetical protein
MSFLGSRSPMLLSLITLSLLAACSSRSSRGGRGDDDTTDDDTSSDDDTTPVGDDDTSSDDDTSVGDDDSQADDDTSQGDDDTSAGFNPDALSFVLNITANSGPSTNIFATFVVQYWEDIQNGVLLCNQRMEIDGIGQFGYGVMGSACGTCTGSITLYESTLLDISNAGVDPDDCDPAVLAAAQFDFGTAMLTGPGAGGYGDFLDFALLDANSIDQLGQEYSQDNSTTTADLITDLSDAGVTFTHYAAVEAATGSLSEASQLYVVAEAIGSTDWYPYFWLGVDPSVNSNTGMEMDGDYLGQAMWILTFNN